MMAFLDVTLGTLAENLALDEALLLQAEAGQGAEVLRVWEWPHPAVVLGAGCRLSGDVDESACLADNVPILRRSSGGGTVLLGAGCLLYSLVLSQEGVPALAGIVPSYRYILKRIRAALEDVLPGIEIAGTSDLALAGRKFSGNAQQRKRTYLLHHGSLLYAFDLHRIGRCLRQPARQPEYRRHRDHVAFLVNLPLAAEEIKQRLRTAWQAAKTTTAWPRALVGVLATTKYHNEDWIKRR